MAHLTKNNPSFFNISIFIVMILCGFALYIIPLQSTSFYYDDYASVEYNPAITAIDIPKIFNAFNTRFLVGLSFALNYKWCALNPAGYRIVNLLIHCLNAFLIYLLIKSTLRLCSARKPVFSCRLEWPSFFASMLFLCHPIQTEPVNFITQRFVLMGSFFYMLTLYLYIQYRCRSQKKYMIAAVASAIAAMFCKEFVVTLPLMLTLYEFYFLGPLTKTWWKRCRRILPFFVIALIVPILLLRTPPEVIGAAKIADSHIMNHIDITRAPSDISRKQYFLTELNVVCTYVRLLFLPVNQNLDYDYPLANELDLKTALCGVFLLCLLALAAVTYKSHRIVSFGILWFFIALSVESSFIPIEDVINEYRLYLASAGFVLLLATLIYTIRMDVRKLNVLAAAILIGFSVLTFQRNEVWKDEVSLWNDVIHKSPHKARGYNDRGIAYYKQGQFDQAMADFNKAIELNPIFPQAFLDRGSIYMQQGRIPQAMADFSQAIAINPKYLEAYNNRSYFYTLTGHLTQALSDLDKIIEINPNYEGAYFNRGNIYFRLNDLDKAIADYTQAITLNPRFEKPYTNLIAIYYGLNEIEKAWDLVHKAQEAGCSVSPKLIQALKESSGRDKK